MKRVILIVGASGVGKDTLIKSIKNKLDGNFVKRYITREPDNHESNFYVDKEAFEILENDNFFVSTWKAHDNHYGIANTHIKNGLNIISISRGAIKDFEDRYDYVTTINITLSKDELLKRLKNRGRELNEDIEKRINRNSPLIDAKDLREFDNFQSIEESSQEFIKLIQSIKNEK